MIVEDDVDEGKEEEAVEIQGGGERDICGRSWDVRRVTHINHRFTFLVRFSILCPPLLLHLELIIQILFL